MLVFALDEPPFLIEQPPPWLHVSELAAALVWKRTSEARCASSVLGSCTRSPAARSTVTTSASTRTASLIGRIRFGRDRVPRRWLWTVTVTIPGPPFGDADSIDQAEARLAAWLAFKEQYSADQLAKAYAAMNHASRPGRYQRR